MKILSIGNSFSQDAQRYLQRLAKHDGVNFKTVNLYIGGCSLRTHYLNMLDDVATYDFEFNGEKTGLKVSIREALASDNWDVITLQQASGFSGVFESYSPYIEELAKYVRKYCPHSKILIHETWAYENGSDKLKNLNLFNSSDEMLSALKISYEKAAELICADGIIPCGDAMMKATKMGIEKIHRDTFHASLALGRYAIALVWLKALFGVSPCGNSFREFDEPLSDEDIAVVQRVVDEIQIF